VKSTQGWSRRLGLARSTPIALLKSKNHLTLEGMAAYIMALPKSKQRNPEWQTAGEAVIMATEDRGPLMHAHIGVMRVLNRHVGACSIPIAKTRIQPLCDGWPVTGKSSPLESRGFVFRNPGSRSAE
jgi:hypothetical protein